MTESGKQTDLMPRSAVDFTWACHQTLKAFELSDYDDICEDVLGVIVAQLASMPNLISTEIKNVKIKAAPDESKTMALVSSMFSKLLSKSNAPKIR